MLTLLDTVRETQARFLSPEMGYTDPEEIGEGERALSHILYTALAFWLEADPERPVFQRYVTPTRKLLGDNPDSIYFFAPIRDDRNYRVTGNVGAAPFTSLTIEAGSSDGHAARKSIAALADDEMEIAKDGSYEIFVGPEAPARGNWLKTGPGASQITTRHYHESLKSIAANPGTALSIQIDASCWSPSSPYTAAMVSRMIGFPSLYLTAFSSAESARTG